MGQSDSVSGEERAQSAIDDTNPSVADSGAAHPPGLNAEPAPRPKAPMFVSEWADNEREFWLSEMEAQMG